MIRLSDNIMTKAVDKSVKDTMRGAYIWCHEKPDQISQIYHGLFLHEQDRHQPGGGLEVMEKDDQIGGLELWNGVDQLQISRFGKTKGSKP